MTNGGTQRAPCVGRTDMTYRRLRSGRSASTHGFYPEAKILGTGAMTGDEPRVLCRCRACPTCPTSQPQVGQRSCPRRIGFVRLVRLVRLNFVSAAPPPPLSADPP